MSLQCCSGTSDENNEKQITTVVKKGMGDSSRTINLNSLLEMPTLIIYQRDEETGECAYVRNETRLVWDNSPGCEPLQMIHNIQREIGKKNEESNYSMYVFSLPELKQHRDYLKVTTRNKDIHIAIILSPEELYSFAKKTQNVDDSEQVFACTNTRCNDGIVAREFGMVMINFVNEQGSLCYSRCARSLEHTNGTQKRNRMLSNGKSLLFYDKSNNDWSLAASSANTQDGVHSYINTGQWEGDTDANVECPVMIVDATSTTFQSGDHLPQDKQSELFKISALNKVYMVVPLIESKAAIFKHANSVTFNTVTTSNNALEPFWVLHASEVENTEQWLNYNN